MEETHQSFKEMIGGQKREAGKAIAIAGALAMVALGVGFSGYHNYMLFKRGVGAGGELVAFIPPILLEGSVLLMMLAQFVWFKDPKQKLVAQVVSWVLIAVIAVNTVIDHNTQAQEQLPAWLQTYAVFMLPATPVAMYAIWKLIIDLDPAKRHREQEAAMQQALEAALFQRRMEAIDGETFQQVLDEYRQNQEQREIDRIRGSFYRPEMAETLPSKRRSIASIAGEGLSHVIGKNGTGDVEKDEGPKGKK
jgi:hypothetical protein